MNDLMKNVMIDSMNDASLIRLMIQCMVRLRSDDWFIPRFNEDSMKDSMHNSMNDLTSNLIYDLPNDLMNN